MHREHRLGRLGHDPIEWMFGGVVSVGCLTVYLTLRPPLFDYDGYMYRKWAMAAEPWYNANPHHLLWNACQMAVAKLAYSLGHPTTVPFQVAGILESCAVLFLSSYGCEGPWIADLSR